MTKLLNKFKEKRETLKNKKNYFKENYLNILDKHKDDLIKLKVIIYQKFRNEYFTKEDNILKIQFEYNVEEYPGGYKAVVIYNKFGYRLCSYEKLIFNYNIDIDKELKETYPGIYSKFSAKQIITSSLNDENPIITYYISREDFKKSYDNITEKEETIRESYAIKKRWTYTFK